MFGRFAVLPSVHMLQTIWLGNSLRAWITAAATAIVLFVALMLIRRLAVARLSVVAARTTNQLDDMVVVVLAETRKLVLFAISLYFGRGPLLLGGVGPYLTTAAKLLLLYQLALWGGAAIGFWVKHYLTHRTGTHDRASVAMIGALGVGAKAVLWMLVAITSLKSVFGIEITALITTLGVGGIAVALAVQNILGDLLAALAIVFDKPFDVGDSIAVDQLSGTVEHIGLKTTRIRSVNGEQVIIGNSDLLKSRLRNFKRMRERRVVFNLDVTFDTPADVLARLPGILEEIVKSRSPVRFDRSHVASFGESARRIETVYFVLDPDYKLYMDTQQAVNLEILRRFAAEGVKFAFPSRTVYHEGAVGGPAATAG
jgi:small-conductance mechanosensitive channel